MFCKTLPTRIVVIQSHIQNTNAMIVAIGECQTSPLVKSFKLREPQTSKTWKLLNCVSWNSFKQLITTDCWWQHLPDLQSLHHECILLQEKFCLDDKKGWHVVLMYFNLMKVHADLKTSELRLLQFSSMVHGVVRTDDSTIIPLRKFDNPLNFRLTRSIGTIPRGEALICVKCNIWNQQYHPKFSQWKLACLVNFKKRNRWRNSSKKQQKEWDIGRSQRLIHRPIQFTRNTHFCKTLLQNWSGVKIREFNPM